MRVNFLIYYIAYWIAYFLINLSFVGFVRAGTELDLTGIKVDNIQESVIREVVSSTMYLGSASYLGVENTPKPPGTSVINVHNGKVLVTEGGRFARIQFAESTWKFRQRELYGPETNGVINQQRDMVQHCQSTIFGAKYLIHSLMQPFGFLSKDVSVQSLDGIELEINKLLETKGDNFNSWIQASNRLDQVRVGGLLGTLENLLDLDHGSNTSNYENEQKIRVAISQQSGGYELTADQADWTIRYCKNQAHIQEQVFSGETFRCNKNDSVSQPEFISKVQLALDRLDSHASDGFKSLMSEPTGDTFDNLLGRMEIVSWSSPAFPGSLSANVINEKRNGISTILIRLYTGSNQNDAIATFNRYRSALKNICLNDMQLLRWDEMGDAIWVRYSDRTTLLLGTRKYSDPDRWVTLLLVQNVPIW